MAKTAEANRARLAIKQSFAPVVDSGTRLLLLGSLPGDRSLAACRYYGNPRNQFWTLTGELVGVALVPLDYPDRLKALLAAGVGLWDVVASATRPGSLDTAIRGHTANDLEALAASLPELRAVGFNGGRAAAIGGPLLCGSRVDLVALPSSSPAFTLPLEAKRAQWLGLRRYLRSA